MKAINLSATQLGITGVVVFFQRTKCDNELGDHDLK